MKATTRYMIAAALVAVALLSMLASWEPAAPAPGPAPGPSEFSLRGKFQGPSASSDAGALAGLCDELAEMVAYDGSKPAGEQRIRTGASIEDLRVAARDARMRGDSIGARQPRAREAIQQFLDQAAGTDGGPLTPEKRADWVAAFRAVGKAAADAAQ